MNSEKIENNIKKFGWHFLFVFDPKGLKADFAYSIGFEQSFNHPEIIIFGLKKDTAHGILANIAQKLRNGSELVPNVRLNDVIAGGLDVILKPVREEALSDYLGIAVSYYGKPFRVNVLFWPDKANILPTEAGCRLTLQNEALKII